MSDGERSGPERGHAARRGVVRLVVVSADGHRVLARPNGLAGWNLPAIPAFDPPDSWTAEAATRAGALLGVPVEGVRYLPPDGWVVTTTGRITASGNTWIAAHEARRLGADEAVLRRWAASERDDGDRTSSETRDQRGDAGRG